LRVRKEAFDLQFMAAPLDASEAAKAAKA